MYVWEGRGGCVTNLEFSSVSCSDLDLRLHRLFWHSRIVDLTTLKQIRLQIKYKAVLRIRIRNRWIRKILASLIRIRKISLSKPKFELLKKIDNKNFLIS